MKLVHQFLQPFPRVLRGIFLDCPLPEFLIIGAQKGGTTSLYSYLIQHPGIIPPEKKEIHYFGNQKNLKRGEAWYRSHFPSKYFRKLVEKKLGYAPITGEATPDMEKPLVPKLVHELLPHAKLIAVLRNPVDRAFSQYHHNRKVPGREPLTFEEAIAQSVDPMSEEGRKDERRSGQPKRRNYITRGFYAEQLELWYHYYPKDRIHISSSEEFFADPALEVKEILKFLEMPDFPIDCSVPRHIGGYKTQMSHEMRAYLEVIFRPHNRKFYDLTGKNFGWPD
jgi:hypothetical protein